MYLPSRHFIGYALPAVYRVTEDVEHASERILADRNADTVSARRNRHTADKVLTFREHNASDGIAADMLCDLHYSGLTVDLDRQSLLYVRDTAGLKLAVYNRSRDLNDPSRIHQLSPITTAPACGSFLSCEKCSCRYCPKSECRVPSGGNTAIMPDAISRDCGNKTQTLIS